MIIFPSESLMEEEMTVSERLARAGIQVQVNERVVLVNDEVFYKGQPPKVVLCYLVEMTTTVEAIIFLSVIG